jgi:hypothetical protein
VHRELDQYARPTGIGSSIVVGETGNPPGRLRGDVRARIATRARARSMASALSPHVSEVVRVGEAPGTHILLACAR